MLDLVKQNYGLLLVVVSQLFLSVVNIGVKKLNSIDPPVPTLELIFLRMVKAIFSFRDLSSHIRVPSQGITYAFSIGYMLYTKVPHPFLGPEGVRLLLLLRGFSGFFGIFGIYYALQYLSLSDATVLTFLAPLCTSISGAIFLNEKLTKRELVAGVLSLVGVIFIARPVSLFGHATAELSQLELELDIVQGLSSNPSGPAPIPTEDVSEEGTPAERLIAVGVSLLGVLGATGAYTTLRAIGKRAHPLHSMAAFSLQSIVVSTLGMIATHTGPVVPTKITWLAWLIEIGVFGFLAQICLTMGLQRETAGRGTMAVYTQIIFASIGERIFFHIVPSALSILGTLIIIGSALYIALTKEREAASIDHVALEDFDSSQAAMEQGLLASYDDSQRLSVQESHGSLKDTVGSWKVEDDIELVDKEKDCCQPQGEHCDGDETLGHDEAGHARDRDSNLRSLSPPSSSSNISPISVPTVGHTEVSPDVIKSPTRTDAIGTVDAS
ncbi:hypothetical protein D9758_012094 [Tetrapyrgos nigripes]|uniref:EamA domain-containing protein n=1 Tax=Tetrapyrgos nigripes TaxID=182062 RepID=A0A8H5FJ82_9AGAR|nr:hypothetical protein D9758_012094 [Tetrapyrgos nigripes]